MLNSHRIYPNKINLIRNSRRINLRIRKNRINLNKGKIRTNLRIRTSKISKENPINNQTARKIRMDKTKIRPKNQMPPNNKRINLKKVIQILMKTHPRNKTILPTKKKINLIQLPDNQVKINKEPPKAKKDKVLVLILPQILKTPTGMIAILIGTVKMNKSVTIRTIYGKKQLSKLNVKNSENKKNLKRKVGGTK